MKVKSLSRVRLSATQWTVARQAPLSMGFSGQEYWSGVPFPSPGDLPNPGIEPRSPALQADALSSEPPGKPLVAKKPKSQKAKKPCFACPLTCGSDCTTASLSAFLLCSALVRTHRRSGVSLRCIPSASSLLCYLRLAMSCPVQMKVTAPVSWSAPCPPLSLGFRNCSLSLSLQV